MSEFDYELFVIGGGSGGVRAARVAGSLGKKVALAEGFRMGGTCVIRGCVPKKLYVYASHYSEMFEDAKSFGWQLEQPQLDWPALVAAKEKEITRLEGLYRKGLENAGVTIFSEFARFIDSHTIELSVSKKRITAEKFLIATGAYPNTDFNIAGLECAITSNELFDLPELPKKLTILGGGYTAVEFANIFHGLGSEVTLVYWKDLILRGFDYDSRVMLQEEMANKGINLQLQTVANRIEQRSGVYHITLSNGEVIEANQIVAALGRKPNSANLGLEEIGIEVDSIGLIKVDEYMQTNVSHIWAIGDVANHYQLTPVAIHEAMCFIQTAFHDNPKMPDYENIATTVFSQPELGKVGLLESEAAKQYENVEIYQACFRPMMYSLSDRSSKVLLKLVVDADSRRLLGAHMLGDGAGEMMQLMSPLLKAGVTKELLDSAMPVHPTVAEEFVTMRTPHTIYQNGQKILAKS